MKTMMESRVVSSCWRAGVGRLRRYSREPGQKGRKLKFLLWTLLTLTVCSSVALPQKVKVGYDKSVDFSKYATPFRRAVTQSPDSSMFRAICACTASTSSMSDGGLRIEAPNIRTAINSTISW